MRWRILVAPLATLLFTEPALAQDSYPSRRVHLIVGLGAGSSMDVAARVVGQKMGQETTSLTQPQILAAWPFVRATSSCTASANASISEAPEPADGVA